MPVNSRTPLEYWLLAQGLAGTLVCRLGLLALPLPAVRKAVRMLLRADHPLPRGRRATPEQVIRAAVSAGIHSPVGQTCLATALVAQTMLRRHGHDARLRLGVRRNPDGKIAAHAWLEREGLVVVGGPPSEVATYAPLPEMEHLIR
jgi:hypothetical protein